MLSAILLHKFRRATKGKTSLKDCIFFIFFKYLNTDTVFILNLYFGE